MRLPKKSGYSWRRDGLYSLTRKEKNAEFRFDTKRESSTDYGKVSRNVFQAKHNLQLAE